MGDPLASTEGKLLVNGKAHDVIVIGSGMAGLTAACLFARKGLRTLLFEKEGKVGGYVVSFTRGEFSIDATGAFVGGCQENGEFSQVLRETGAQEFLEFIPIHQIKNIYPGFEVHPHQGGSHPYSEALLSLFPEEKDGLKTYLSLVERIGEEMKSYSEMTLKKKVFFPFYFWNLIRYQRLTHQAILDKLFRGVEIKMALHTLPATDPPSKLSFLFVAIAINKALMEGVFYPKGGMGKISEALSQSFLQFGGEVFLQKEVAQISIKDGKVDGVETKDGEMFRAPLVISDINPNLIAKMVPLEFQTTWMRKLRRLEYSLSCFILYIGTDLDLKGLGLPYFTYLRSIIDLEEEYRILQKGDIPKNPTLIVSVPTLLDPSLAPPGRHIMKVLITVPYHYREAWGRDDPDESRQIKEDFSQKTLQQLESKLVPNLRKHLLFYEAATPLTLERYTGNERGAMYGLASTPSQIGIRRPSHQTPILGLFQVGHYTRPSHSIVGASLSGLFCARSILQQLHRT